MLLLTISSCNSPKSAVLNSDANLNTIETVCPEDGKCTVQLFKNKSLEVKTDEFGSVYYQMTDNTQTSVILYQYKRNVEKGLQDAHYTEEIIFEISHSDTSIALNGLNLQKTKMLFGRLCFCRGQTGYYKVTDGNLELEQKNNEARFSLHFTITEVPQIIHSITASAK